VSEAALLDGGGHLFLEGGRLSLRAPGFFPPPGRDPFCCSRQSHRRNALPELGQDEHKGETTSPPPSVSFIYENVRERSRCICGLARYVREPRLRAPSPLCVRQDRDGVRLDDDDVRLRDDTRRPDDGDHLPDASGTLPWRYSLPTSLEKRCRL
jgi:hypothetical protein